MLKRAHVLVAATGLALGPSAVGLTASPVRALTINDTFEASIQNDPNASAIETVIQTASNQIASAFSNNATINIVFGTDASVGGGQSTSVWNYNSYQTYTKLLQNDVTANPANQALGTALANLGYGNGSNGQTGVYSTTAQLRALGVSINGSFDANGNYVGAGQGSQDGVITVNPNYVLTISVLQHEIDEILGGGGMGSTLGTGYAAYGYGATDLYRYSGLHSSSYNTASNATACFSLDGGQTCIAAFNQAGNGTDYGDFLSPYTDSAAPCLIQSAYICSNPDSFNTNSPEFQMLEAIGYGPSTLAVPGPVAGAGLPGLIAACGALIALARRRRKLA